MEKIIIATHNAGKAEEFKKLLGNKFEIYTLPYGGYDGQAEENGATFYENALIKAKDVYDNTGITALADDSGLCVNALGGAPGVYSARYGGNCTQDEKNSLLINELQPFSDKSAKFVCSLVLYGKNGVIASGYGETLGEILPQKDGDGGFGYDGIFYSYDLKKSFGKASDEEKNSVSHRARALRDLISKL